MQFRPIGQSKKSYHFERGKSVFSDQGSLQRLVNIWRNLSILLQKRQDSLNRAKICGVVGNWTMFCGLILGLCHKKQVDLCV